VCACGRRGACASESTRRVLGKRPQRLGRDANATSRPRRGGERARRGRGAGMAGLGVIGPCSTGAHARARVLASQGCGVAVPCAGHRHPGPAARRGGGRATAVAGVQRRRVELLHKKDGTAAGRVGRSYGLLPRVHRRLMAHAGSRGKERDGGSVAHRRAGEEGARGCGEARPVGRGRAGRAAALVSSIGRRRGEAPVVASVVSSSLGSGWRRWRPPQALLLLLFLSSHFSSCGGGGKV
jgi:hypothetical protein